MVQSQEGDKAICWWRVWGGGYYGIVGSWSPWL